MRNSLKHAEKKGELACVSLSYHKDPLLIVISITFLSHLFTDTSIPSDAHPSRSQPHPPRSTPNHPAIGALLGTQTGREVSIINTFELILTTTTTNNASSGDVDMDAGPSGSGSGSGGSGSGSVGVGGMRVDLGHLGKRRDQCTSPVHLIRLRSLHPILYLLSQTNTNTDTNTEHTLHSSVL